MFQGHCGEKLGHRHEPYLAFDQVIAVVSLCTRTYRGKSSCFLRMFDGAFR